MRCPSCDFENPEGLKFCNDCGAAFKRRCTQCGFDNALQAKFCGECGASLVSNVQLSVPSPQHPVPHTQPLAERRQLTVLFCDLVDSTALSEQLDPEEYREVVRAYQQASATVIAHYTGHIAQYLGDGLLVYFGYPVAHEDDAQRAVRTALGIVQAVQQLSFPTIQLSRSLQVHIGIHTGLVVIGEIGSSEKHEILALGETPNIAARLQGLAEPDTVVMSAVTQRLVLGLFDCQDLGLQTLKGISSPLSLQRVLGESQAQSRFDVAVGTGLTPLVGRDEELALLRRRWTQASDGAGQVVLLSGEPGIGKSRLVQELKEQVNAEGATRIEFRCSPYYQNSALYPIIDHLQRLLHFQSTETPQTKLAKLTELLSRYHFPRAETLPLLAAMFSLPPPEGAPPLSFSPQKQKQLTLAALVAWLLEEAERAVVCCTWEDLHWADPSTLEILTLFLDQAPTARVLTLLTFRPEFTPPWSNRSHFSQLTLSRLDRHHIETMIERVTGGKPLPAEVVQQIVAKTDGVPLFVEELTKTVVESGLVREEDGRYVGAQGSAPIPPLAIPATLHDSLMARLDRLNTAKEIAQLGATLGREFSYELLQAVSPVEESSLQEAITKLVDTEVLYQRGLPPRARYIFKHALIQDTAYQSLLKSKRQQYHQRIAQVLEERFRETKETQPELLAHHYTEAGLAEQAIPYWQQAGQRASQRSANVEAISHLTRGLELLKTLPDTPERSQQELRLQIALGAVLMATRGYASPEARQAYARARDLCEQMENTPQLSPVLYGLFLVYLVAGEHKTAHGLAASMLRLAHRQQAPTLLLPAHRAFGQASVFLGEPVVAREHLEQGIALYDPQKHNPHASGVTTDSGVVCRNYAGWALWLLGYPDQALKRMEEALTLARQLAHPHSLAHALAFAAMLHQHRQDGQAAQEQAEAGITLCTDQGFPFFLAMATILHGWALAEQGQGEEGTAQIRQGVTGLRATGAELNTTYYLALLAEMHERGGQAKEGLTVVGEALAIADKNEEHFYDAELYRLKGELLLAQEGCRPQAEGCREKTEETEACFLQAIGVAQKQQAKSLELRAVMSLVRLRQQQASEDGSRNTNHVSRAQLEEAHRMLSEVYNWFTEGFDTKDLQEAKALLEDLGELAKWRNGKKGKG
ncbi:MAG: adenylate/guanylate cyclase domain-containing protein [Candidatus Binatia bacterium]